MSPAFARPPLRLVSCIVTTPVAFFPLRDLCLLAVDGATVDTYHDGKLALRTIIQLDGDLLTFVTPTAVDRAVRSAHSAEVTTLLTRIAAQVHGVAHIVTWPLGLAIFGILYVSLPPLFPLQVWDSDDWIRILVFNVGLPSIISTLGHVPLTRRLLGKGLLKTLRFWLRAHSRWSRVQALVAATRTPIPPSDTAEPKQDRASPP